MLGLTPRPPGIAAPHLRTRSVAMWDNKCVRTCKKCGRDFPCTRQQGAPGRPPLYCSKRCRNASQYTPRPKPRASCLSPEQRSEVARNASRARWANDSETDRSVAARAAASARWAGHVAPPKRTREVRKCRYCDTEKLMTPRQAICGADECRLRRNAARMGRFVHARRAQQRQLPSESFDPAEIYARDGWTCGICSLPVDPDLRHPDRMSVSLDHVIPLSCGGHHTRENVRCAHLDCNVKRGNRAA